MYRSKPSMGYLTTPSIFKNGGPLPIALLFARVLVVMLNRSAASLGFTKYFVMRIVSHEK
jgi:hypothetical protein